MGNIENLVGRLLNGSPDLALANREMEEAAEAIQRLLRLLVESERGLTRVIDEQEEVKRQRDKYRQKLDVKAIAAKNHLAMSLGNRQAQGKGTADMTPANLIAARERMGLTQARLAELLGVHIRTLSAWEYGRQKIPPYLHLAIRALDTPGRGM